MEIDENDNNQTEHSSFRNERKELDETKIKTHVLKQNVKCW